MAWQELNQRAEPNQRGAQTPRVPSQAAAADQAAGQLKGCDARSVWATASDFRNFARTTGAGGERIVPVAVQVNSSASPEERDDVARHIGRRGIFKAIAAQCNFWTGAVQVQALAGLSNLPAVKGWRIGLENIPGVDKQRHAPGSEWMTDALQPHPLVGIIDHGLAVAHSSFRFPGQPAVPRLLSLWDQDPQRRSKPNNRYDYWSEVKGIGYGGELSHNVLKDLIAHSAGRDEWIYQQLRYEPALTRVSHGTHVLDLAAGWPNPLAKSGAPAAPETVSQSRIVAVQLPYKPARDASGSALCVHVLDALHYIVSKAVKKQRVVINLSDGAYGGAHDGSSMLERAIDEFLGQRPQVTLVLAAGNAHETAGHARLAGVVCGSKAQFNWRILPDDYTDSYMEVWFDKVCPAGSVVLTVVPPGSVGAVTVPMGSVHRFRDADDTLLACVISRQTSPDGPARSMFLVAVAPTRPRDRQHASAPHGVWQVSVHNVSAGASVNIDAWIERDNPVINESGPRRQSFFEDRHCHPLVVDGQGTLGSLAGSGQAIVVGGRYRRGKASSGCDTSKPSVVAKYSSRGPGRARTEAGPDLLAPSDDSPVQHGLLAAANHAGAKFRMDGTSVSAPIVTRRIVNLLGAANPPQDRDALMVALIGPTPSPDPDLTGERGSIEPGVEPPPAVASLRLAASLM